MNLSDSFFVIKYNFEILVIHPVLLLLSFGTLLSSIFIFYILISFGTLLSLIFIFYILILEKESNYIH